MRLAIHNPQSIYEFLSHPPGPMASEGNEEEVRKYMESIQKKV